MTATRLATILAVDVDGDSRLMGENRRGRRGRYKVEGLAEHGKLTDLLANAR